MEKTLFTCELVTKEWKVVGMHITAPFPAGFPDAALQIHHEFWAKRNTIKHAVNRNVLLSPFICNEIVATYFACLEVDNLTSVPEGMMGFSIPATRYAQVSCTNKTIEKGYDVLMSWMHQNGYRQKVFKAFQVEVYDIQETAEEESVKLLIPILEGEG
ncbi:GyrI-like domain-containing protein [Brevibacillus panacihumi]|uniref:GyrI-like domain-containing protein n=1 Tax=Brevibacillus panacihumi TaxID=497735 RepID=UPI003D24C100